jgi:hypothetical protein
MAVRNNIGKVAAAISAGIEAKNSIYTGPLSDPSVVSHRFNSMTTEWGEQHSTPSNGFIFGIHAWGSRTKRVTKR